MLEKFRATVLKWSERGLPDLKSGGLINRSRCVIRGWAARITNDKIDKNG